MDIKIKGLEEKMNAMEGNMMFMEGMMDVSLLLLHASTSSAKAISFDV